ncbi:MAG: hypothetical protein GTO63_10075, partial [Anaerolineae bacterium]|nr:hypothetical protein [Anaerolineae bacterium]NIN95247.1 hypothetical protein [Anaerolineae bacterium]
KEHLGDSEVDGEFRWEFTKAWKGGSKKKAKTAKPGETMVASIVASLTQTAPDADDDEFDDEYDEEYDEDDDELEDVLQ